MEVSDEIDELVPIMELPDAIAQRLDRREAALGALLHIHTGTEEIADLLLWRAWGDALQCCGLQEKRVELGVGLVAEYVEAAPAGFRWRDVVVGQPAAVCVMVEVVLRTDGRIDVLRVEAPAFFLRLRHSGEYTRHAIFNPL